MTASRLWVGASTKLLILLLFVVGIASLTLELDVSELWPSAAGRSKAVVFFHSAVVPAVSYESSVPAGTEPLLWKVVKAMGLTLSYAVVALSVAIPVGFVFALLASLEIWQSPSTRRAKHTWVLQIPRAIIRGISALLRSVHELLWAILFLRVFGINSMTGVLAIAVPYSGVFAKTFSEILDETPRNSANALQALGASRINAVVFGFLPRALTDMFSVALYQLECAIRSSAVMGFFGLQTLGFYLAPAFKEHHYRELWTYLYALLALILLISWWSSEMRRRLHS